MAAHGRLQSFTSHPTRPAHRLRSLGIPQTFHPRSSPEPIAFLAVLAELGFAHHAGDFDIDADDGLQQAVDELGG